MISDLLSHEFYTMNDYQDDKSKYAACLTDHLPSFGRALLIAAVDFSPTNWIAEHYVLPPSDAPIKGASILTSFNPVSIPQEIIPSPDEELTQALDSARAALTNIIFEQDRT